jgi:GT2 family glycosyltransferase
VVVLNWNSWWFTRRCLAALARTEHPADRLEVVLVDNASVDGSLERLRHEFPDVRIVRNATNLGFAEGCNRAMRDLRGVDMVALVNNDAVVEPGWLAALVAALDEHPRAGAAAARLVLEPRFARLRADVQGGPVRVCSVRVDGADATTRTRFSGAVRTEGRTEWPMELEHHLDGVAELLVPAGDGEHLVELEVEGRGRVTLSCGTREATGGPHVQVPVGAHDERVELLNGLGTERNEVGESYDRHFGEPNDPAVVPELAGPPVQVTGFSGGGVLLRSELLAQVGLFDPTFFAYYEDSDLSWRAARAGWVTVTAPGSVIRHAFGGSGGSRSPGFFFLNYRNWLLTVLRNAEADLRRRALASGRERVRWAVRANVASPLKHRHAPDGELVAAWARTWAGVAAVRRRQRRDHGRLPGSARTDDVHAAFQPEFHPRGPSRRPGGPVVVVLDLSGELDGTTGAATALLAAMSTADLSLDVVPVHRSPDGVHRQVGPALVGRLLGIDGPYQPTSAEGLALPELPAGAVLASGGPGTELLTCSSVPGDPLRSNWSEPLLVPPEPAALRSAIAAATDRPTDPPSDRPAGR